MGIRFNLSNYSLKLGDKRVTSPITFCLSRTQMCRRLSCNALTYSDNCVGICSTTTDLVGLIFVWGGEGESFEATGRCHSSSRHVSKDVYRVAGRSLSQSESTGVQKSPQVNSPLQPSWRRDPETKPKHVPNSWNLESGPGSHGKKRSIK